jgi:ketosteroid isomerase-like protein
MKQLTTFFLTLAFAVVFISSCDNKNTSSENKEVKTAEFDLNAMKKVIKEKTDRFTQAHIIKDTTFLNNIFTLDAKVYAPHADVVTGKVAISALNIAWVNYGIKEFSEVSTSFYGNEAYLIDEGTYYYRYGEDNTFDKGKYINIWKKEDGDWKIFSNIWNTSLPGSQPE